MPSADASVAASRRYETRRSLRSIRDRETSPLEDERRRGLVASTRPAAANSAAPNSAAIEAVEVEVAEVEADASAEQPKAVPPDPVNPVDLDPVDVDEKLQQFRDALETSGLSPLRRVSVEVGDGWVRLSGRVSSFYQKQLAQETVRPYAIGLQIDNRIAVSIH